MPTNAKAAGATAALALALAACGSSSNGARSHATRSATPGSTASTPTRTVSQSLAVTVTTPGTEPVAGGYWPITVRARTPSGGPASGTVSYAFLFGGATVARRPGGHMSAGVFHDRLEFPAQSVGYPLTVHVIVRGANGESGSTERAVRVRG
jgi:hypothetical protein